jgi:hypothetical protein
VIRSELVGRGRIQAWFHRAARRALGLLKAAGGPVGHAFESYYRSTATVVLDNGTRWGRGMCEIGAAFVALSVR